MIGGPLSPETNTLTVYEGFATLIVHDASIIQPGRGIKRVDPFLTRKRPARHPDKIDRGNQRI
jgi:hypothetical protein